MHNTQIHAKHYRKFNFKRGHMKKTILLLLLFISVSLLFTSNREIDSLYTELELADDSEKIAILDILAGNFWELSPNERIPLALQMVELSEKLKDQGYKADAYNYLGIAYNQLDETQKSLDYFHKALDIFEELDDKSGIARTFLNLAQANLYLDNFDKALEYSKKNLAISLEIGDKKGMFMALNGLGTVMAKTERYDEALDYLFQALTIVKEINDKIGISQIYNNIGNVYFVLEETDKVLEYRLQSLEIIRELDNKWELALITYNIAEYYLENNEPDKAYPYLLESQELAEMLDNQGLIRDNTNFYSWYYELKEDYKKALKYLKDYSKLTKQQFSEELSETTAEMQIKYETEKKERQNEIYKLLIEKQRTDQTRLIGGLILFFIFLVVICLLYLAKNKTNKLLKKEITEHKKAEEALKSVYDDLDSFSYSVSHDLRSPLRALDGFAKILLEECTSDIDAEGAHLLNLISSNANKMNKMIEDLLSFSRLGRKAIVKSTVNMNTLFSNIFNELRIFSPERKINFNVSQLPSIIADVSLMQHVITNLLSNAIKFTQSKEEADIQVGSFNKDDQVIYYVRDNGVGFNMKYAGKLFNVFQRLHSTMEFEGSGAGLAIVQKIIQKHGGKIWAEAEVNKGATFYFSLPKMIKK